MPSPRLLVVDDDKDLSQYMMSVAMGMGFKTDHCDTPEDLRAIYTNEFTVIIVDMIMPTMDGVEVIRFLAEQRSLAGIILVSSMAENILRAGEKLILERDLQLVGSLQKPFPQNGLSALLSKACLAVNAKRMHRHPLTNTDSKQPREDELLVLFQPKIDLKTLDCHSVEALVRWQHPEKGLLGPRFFVPEAESDGRIEQITTTIFHQTLAQCNQWSKEGVTVNISINISPRSLSDVAAPDRILELVRQYSVRPSQIVLEITETWLSEDPVNCLDSLLRLALMGFSLSIDDFGTGYSSIAQLSKIPFSELKIDQSFVRQAPGNQQARSILESSVKLGHHLNLRVVAEGVETQQQWDLVDQANCDSCQGFLSPARYEELRFRLGSRAGVPFRGIVKYLGSKGFSTSRAVPGPGGNTDVNPTNFTYSTKM